MILSALVKGRVDDEVTRIKADARSVFGDSEGYLDLDLLATPPAKS